MAIGIRNTTRMRTYVAPRREAVGPPLNGSTVFLSGMEAGIVSGLVMILVAMVWSSVAGNGFWSPLNLIAATWFGQEALAGGLIIGIAGFITHLAISAIWGAVFSAFIGRGARSFGLSLLVGLITGVVAWMVMTYFVLPWADPIMRAQVTQNPHLSAIWFFYHLVYGASMTLTPLFARVPSYDEAWHHRHATLH